MAPSPTTRRKQSPQKRKDSDVTSWTAPKNRQMQKARRVQVWFKQNITQLKSPSAVDFMEGGGTSNSPVKSPSRRIFRSNHDPAQRPLSPGRTNAAMSPRSPSSPQSNNNNHTTTLPYTHNNNGGYDPRRNHTTSRQTTQTIDQAMFSLYTYVGPQKNVSSPTSAVCLGLAIAPLTPGASSYVPNRDYDWFLDGNTKQDETTNPTSEPVEDIREGQSSLSIGARNTAASSWDDDDLLEYANYHLQQPWDMEAYLNAFLQQRERQIQEESQQQEEMFSFEADFGSSIQTDAADDPHHCAEEDDDAQDLPSKESGDDFDEDDFGDFQMADMATPTAANQAIASDRSNHNNNMFDTPLPPQALENAEETSRALSPAKITTVDDSNVTMQQPLSRQVQQQQQQQQEVRSDSSEEEIEEAKSQEEAIVEEAVEILRSLPSKDFNDAFDSSHNGLPCNEVLVETCHLASQLEEAVDDDDDELIGIEDKEIIVDQASMESNSKNTSSLQRQQQEQQAGTSEERSILSTATPTKSMTHVIEDNGSGVLGQSTPVVIGFLGSGKKTNATTMLNSCKFVHKDSSSDDSPAIIDNNTSFNEISEIDEDESTCSIDGIEEGKDKEALSSCALITHFDAAESGDCPTLATQADRPINTHHGKNDGAKADTKSKNTESDEAAPVLLQEEGNSSNNEDDDDSFGDFCDAPAVERERKEVPSCVRATDNVQALDPQELNSSSPPPSLHYVARASTDAASEPTIAIPLPLRVDTTIQVQPKVETSCDQSSQEDAQEAHTHQQQQQQQPSDVPREVFKDPTNSQEDLDESLHVNGDDFGSGRPQQDFDMSIIPISLRLPIQDLSTSEARFTRRQQQLHKEKLQLSQLQVTDRKLLQQMSTSSIFSVSERVDDEDENGDPLLSLADLDLPEYYFSEENFDDTTKVLQNAPWHHISALWEHEDIDNGLHIPSSYSFEDLQDRRELWEEYITQELCHLDTAQNQVSKHLLRRIQPHEAVLQKANQSMHEFATNLQLAQMYMMRSQAAVRQAARGTNDKAHKLPLEGCGWFGANDLLQAWNQQETYRNMDFLLTRINDVLTTENALFGQFSNFAYDANKPHEYSSMTKAVVSLQEDVMSDESLSKICSLNDFHARLARNEILRKGLSRLHILAESVAVRSCRRRYDGLWCEYKSLLESAIETHQLIVDGLTQHSSISKLPLHAPQERLGEAVIPDQEADGPFSTLPSDLSISWPGAILQALCYEADLAMATALLDPLQSVDSDTSAVLIESEFERELTQLSYEIQQEWGDTARLRSVAHNLVIIRFDWERGHLLPVFHRLSVLLADVLYAFHRFQCWHDQIVNDNFQGKPRQEASEKEEKKSDFVDERNKEITATQGEFRRHEERCHVVASIRDEWLKAKNVLWDRCETVLVKCLDEYLHFAKHDSFFQKSSAEADKGGGNGAGIGTTDSRWRTDLEELHSVLVLSEEFGSLKPTFFDGSIAGLQNKPGGLNNDFQDKLCDVFRKHLRHVHVEAMKSLGASLSQENWELVPLERLSIIEKSSYIAASKDDEVLVAKLLAEALSEESKNIDKASLPTRNTAESRTMFGHLPNSSNINQFLILSEPPLLPAESARDSHKSELGTTTEVYNLITSALAEGDGATAYTRFVSSSASDVLFPWVARLLQVMELLPPIVEDVTVVLANLCDLYLTTVFRICAGNGISERILLGVDAPSNVVQNLKRFSKTSPTKEGPGGKAPLFGFRRRSSSSAMSDRIKPQRPSVDLPRSLQADVCAPLWDEKSDLEASRNFIQRAQDTLKDMVLLDKVDNWIVDPPDCSGPGGHDDDDKIIFEAIRNLEQRVGAVFGCLGVAAILDAACSVARNRLVHSETGRKSVKDLETIEHYTQAVFDILPKLVRLCSRIAAVRSILARKVISEILEVGPAWGKCELNEHPNDYVDALCNRCSCIWAALAISPRQLPAGVRQMIWKHIVEGAFCSLLEGFSRVPFCSTEGRALMSMDLAFFAAETNPSAVMEKLEFDNKYDTPERVNPEKGMRYVDTYVKVFYYPKKDVIAWIIENHEKYHLNHCLALAANAYRGDSESSNSDGASVDEVIEMVKGIFRQDKEVENEGDQTASPEAPIGSNSKAPRIEQV